MSRAGHKKNAASLHIQTEASDHKFAASLPLSYRQPRTLNGQRCLQSTDRHTGRLATENRGNVADKALTDTLVGRQQRTEANKIPTFACPLYAADIKAVAPMPSDASTFAPASKNRDTRDSSADALGGVRTYGKFVVL